MAAAVVANSSPRLQLGSAPMVLAHSLLGLELALDALELGRRAVQPPAVAQQRDRRNDRDPDRPELTAGAVAEPDRARAALCADTALETSASMIPKKPAPDMIRGGTPVFRKRSC